jgi:hypothetical protein
MLSVRAATRSWLKTASRVRGRRGGGNASSKRATSLRAPNLKAKKLAHAEPSIHFQGRLAALRWLVLESFWEHDGLRLIGDCFLLRGEPREGD